MKNKLIKILFIILSISLTMPSIMWQNPRTIRNIIGLTVADVCQRPGTKFAKKRTGTKFAKKRTGTKLTNLQGEKWIN